MKKIILFSIILISFFYRSYSQTIKDLFYGQNAWSPTLYFGNTSYGLLDNHWGDIGNSGCKIMRIGGAGYNTNQAPLAEYAYHVTKIKGELMEPAIQVAVGTPASLGGTEASYTVTTARTLLNFINSDPATYCKYWIIGNEPDLIGYTDAATYATKIIAIADGLRAENATITGAAPITIIGPELSYFNVPYINTLITNGILAKIDIFSCHYYPFNDESIPPVSYPGGYGLVPDRNNLLNANSGTLDFYNMNPARSLNQQLIDLKLVLSTAGYGSMPIAITEANICHKNDIDDPSQFVNAVQADLNATLGADDLITGNGANSFIAGQFWAEMLATGMGQGVEFINFWSTVEGSDYYDVTNDPTENNKRTNAGYIDYKLSTNYKKKSTYYHFQMMAQNFKGIFKPNLITNIPEHKAFGYMTTAGDEIGVMIMNEEQGSGDNSFSISFNNSTAPTTGSEIGIQLDAALSVANFDCRIPKETTYFLKFSVIAGVVTLIEHKEYGIQQALANKPPKDITNGDMYITDGLGDQGNEINIESWGGISDDIWSRPSAETSTGLYHYTNENNHINPEYVSSAGPFPYLYAKVINRGCKTASGNVHIYYDDDSFGGSSWKTDWTEITPTIGLPITLAHGDNGVVEQVWNTSTITTIPPLGFQTGYCIIAQFSSSIETDDPPGYSTTYYDGPTNTDPLKYWSSNNDNIMRFNNIGQKNMLVVNNVNNFNIFLANFQANSATSINHIIKFNDYSVSGSIIKNGYVTIDLGQDLYTKWVQGGKQGYGIQERKTSCHLDSLNNCVHKHLSKNGESIYPNPYEIQIVSPNAYISNIMTNRNEHFTIKTRFEYNALYNGNSSDYIFDIKGYEQLSGGENWLGTMRYQITPPTCPTPNAGYDITMGRNCKTTLTASPIIPGTSYIWRNERTGVIVDTGAIIEVSPQVTTSYEIEVKSGNGCIGYDVVTVTINSALQCQPTCGSPTYNNQSLSHNTHVDSVEIVISGTLTVPNNVTLRITDSKINFTENAFIDVLPGGKLVIVNSQLRACDMTKPWKGISVKSNNTLISQFKIKGSSITDAINPIVMTKISNAEIRDNIFADGITAVTMDKCQDFTIAKNQFYTYGIGIHAIRGKVDTKSIIRRNYFYQVKTAVLLEKGNQASLEIQCNFFDAYQDYAIYSDSTILNDQGSLGEGAANLFNSASTKVNNKFRHKGNTMHYYFNPSDILSLTSTGGMTAIAQVSQLDGACVGDEAKENEDNFDGENNGSIVQSSNIESISLNCIPNPATDRVTILYSVLNQSGEIRITNILGELIAKYPVSKDSKLLEVDCSNLNNGIYLYSLIINNTLVNTKKMVITK